jgi:endonuclease/exonuclease/phosphatase family metal-dependent hydrolase
MFNRLLRLAILCAVSILSLLSCTTTNKTTNNTTNNGSGFQGRGIELSADTKLRIVSYNGFFTSIFPNDKGEARTNEWIEKKNASSSERINGFASWAPRANADIFALQETIYTKGSMADTTVEGITEYFNGVTGQKWYAAGDNQGRLILSRHPILWSSRVKNARGMAALIDLPDEVSQDLLLINLHLLSSNAERRVWQARHAVRFIKGVREGAYADIPKDAPVIICGDFNSEVNDLPHSILTKLEEEPDKDDLNEAHYVNPEPRQLKSDSKGTFGSVVWEGEIGSSNYQLAVRSIDHMLIPKGYMTVSNAFVFNSLTLSREDLKRYGVKREDLLLVREGSEEKLDHLPVFIDLK